MGTPLRHSSFYRCAWLPAVAKVGLPGIHFHDLRHAGNTLTETGRVASGASWQGIGQIA
jgi:integrase